MAACHVARRQETSDGDSRGEDNRASKHGDEHSNEHDDEHGDEGGDEGGEGGADGGMGACWLSEACTVTNRQSRLLNTSSSFMVCSGSNTRSIA